MRKMHTQKESLAEYKKLFREYIIWHEKTYKEYAEMHGCKPEEVDTMKHFSNGDWEKLQQYSKELEAMQKALGITEEEDEEISDEILKELKKEGKI